MSDWKIGDRVRMVQTDDSTGTITGPVKVGVGADGGDRIPVKWDRTGKVTEYSPGFLRPIATRAADDPDEVICNGTRRRRGRVYIDSHGSAIVIPDGFSRVETT